MKKRFWVNKDGERLQVVKLTPYEKHQLREKNLKLLREQRLMKETVQYADYTPVDNSDSGDDAGEGT